jgi:hypothetical protein
MSLREKTFGEIVALLSAPPPAGRPLPGSDLKALVKAESDASKAFTEFLEKHPFRPVIDEAWPPGGGSPAYRSVAAFFTRIAPLRRPEFETNVVYSRPMDEVIELLGRLSMEVGREQVEDEIDRFVELQMADRAAQKAMYDDYQMKIDAIIEGAKNDTDSIALVSIGMAIWYGLRDIQSQEDDEYWEGRGNREEAGLMNPHPQTMQSIAYNVESSLRRPEISIGVLEDGIQRQGISSFNLTETVNPLVDAQRIMCRNFEPWWLEGFKMAVAQFGADMTIGAFVDKYRPQAG